MSTLNTYIVQNRPIIIIYNPQILKSKGGLEMYPQMDMQTITNREQKVSCMFAALNIQNSRHGRLYLTQHNGNNGRYSGTANGTPCFGRFHQYNAMFGGNVLYGSGQSGNNNNSNIIGELLTTFKHANKKPQEKLVRMQFLKDSNFVVLGYNKQTDRGDINFIAINQLKNRDFYYNKLTTGVGGIQCFQDGRHVLIADRKGVFSFIDMFQQLDHNKIQEKKIDTGFQGLLDISIAPGQTKIVCGYQDKKCLVLDIEKQRRNKKFIPCNTFDKHNHGVNSVSWHPYKTLVVSSSIYVNDTVKLWDPHSQQLVHQTNLTKNSILKTLFHPEGNTYFSLCKQNMIQQNQIRKRGIVNTFNLQFEPTHMQVMRNNNIVIGDTGGYVSWYTPTGQLIGKLKGDSGVSLFSVDQTNNILVVGREKEHIFQIYWKKNILKINKND